MTGRIACFAMLSLTCLISCSPRAKAPSPSPQSSPLPASALDKASTWRSTLVVDQAIEQRIGSRKIRTRQVSSTTYRFSCLGRNDDGGLSMELSYERLALKLSTAGASYDFDSASTQDPASPLAPLNALVGGRIGFTLGPDHRIGELSGLAELAARIAAASRNPVLAAGASSFLGEGQVRKGLESIFGMFPASSVAVGDSWPLPASGGNPTRIKLTAIGLENDRIAVELTGPVEPSLGGEGTSLRGELKGKVELDPAGLRVLAGELSLSLEGSVRLRGLDVPMRIASSTRFE
jgi:hypothetical protein